jgi:hypothetical protein
MPYVGATEFYEKSRSKKNRSKLFLLLFNSQLTHFDKNLNLNHKWLSPTEMGKPVDIES